MKNYWFVQKSKILQNNCLLLITSDEIHELIETIIINVARRFARFNCDKIKRNPGTGPRFFPESPPAY